MHVIQPISRCFWTMALLTVSLIVAVGCDSTSGPAPLPGPIIVITNSWENASNAKHVFSFTSQDDGQPEGTFTGQEDPDTDVFDDEHDLTGSWAHGRIAFTVDRDGAQTEYVATFTEENPDRLSFAGGGETLVLLRQ